MAKTGGTRIRVAPAPSGGNGQPAALSVRKSLVNNEGFKLLALNVDRLLGSSAKRAIVVMSAHPWEGRSTTAAGLAQALAALAPPVVLIDADPEGSGLGDLVSDDANHASSNGASGQSLALRVEIAVAADGHSSAVLDTVLQAIHRAVGEGATVIVDAPACDTSSLGFYLAADATGVLYVTRTRASRTGSLHADVGAQLELLGARVLGVVVNEG